MQCGGQFTTHYYPITYKSEGKPVYLIPFGDVHRSAPLHAEKHWFEFLDWAKTKKDAYFLGMGDTLDIASASERLVLSRGLHESTIGTLEDLYNREIARFCKEISFMKGRLIGMIEGNHYAEFQSGVTSTQKMCEILGCRYLGCSAFIRLSFRCGNSPGRRSSVDIWAHHGLGASRLIGGSLNRVQQMVEAADADIYLMGHDHKKSVGLLSRLMLTQSDPMDVVHRKILVARTGSFLKGYEPGRVSYVADRGLCPTDLGVVKIELTPKRHKKGGCETVRVDIHASL